MHIHPKHPEQRPLRPGLRQNLYDIIFEAEESWGRFFDIGLLIAIMGSIAIVAIETLPSIQTNPVTVIWLARVELVFAILFGFEYALRIYCTRYPWKYIFSFWGVIDLISFLPSLLVGFGSPRQNAFVIIRSMRLLRVFRILKLWRLMSEADVLGATIWRSRGKIVVFLAVVMVAVTISGTLMYHVENRPAADGTPSTSGFSSIPQSMYWAIVTMTTVGYGDIVPKTIAGKCISAALILLGYSLIIVPTGFVSAEFTAARREASSQPRPPTARRACPACQADEHLPQAIFCHRCGTRLT